MPTDKKISALAARTGATAYADSAPARVPIEVPASVEATAADRNQVITFDELFALMQLYFGFKLVGTGTATGGSGDATVEVTWATTPGSVPTKAFVLVQPSDLSADGIIVGAVDDTSYDLTGCDVELSADDFTNDVEVLVFVTQLT